MGNCKQIQKERGWEGGKKGEIEKEREGERKQKFSFNEHI